MKSASGAVKGDWGGFIGCIIKGALIALSISIIGICIFAFVLRFIDISTDVIKPINQIIKFGSIVIGVFIGLKKAKEMGFVTGLLTGALYTILAFLAFSLLNGSFVFEASLINDIIFGGLAGAISGILAVNFKKK